MQAYFDTPETIAARKAEEAAAKAAEAAAALEAKKAALDAGMDEYFSAEQPAETAAGQDETGAEMVEPDASEVDAAVASDAA